mmetsp:Transcript_26141/g.44960  ORF Transcript_26141/g.44960 Transcript_26141/m.44960 type:complete len:253 (-) Transcript_26141:387-1145(-)
MGDDGAPLARGVWYVGLKEGGDAISEDTVLAGGVGVVEDQRTPEVGEVPLAGRTGHAVVVHQHRANQQVPRIQKPPPPGRCDWRQVAAPHRLTKILRHGSAEARTAVQGVLGAKARVAQCIEIDGGGPGDEDEGRGGQGDAIDEAVDAHVAQHNRRTGRVALHRPLLVQVHRHRPVPRHRRPHRDPAYGRFRRCRVIVHLGNDEDCLADKRDGGQGEVDGVSKSGGGAVCCVEGKCELEVVGVGWIVAAQGD